MGDFWHIERKHMPAQETKNQILSYPENRPDILFEMVGEALLRYVDYVDTKRKAGTMTMGHVAMIKAIGLIISDMQLTQEICRGIIETLIAAGHEP